MNETGNSGRSVTVALPDILERLRGRVHDSHMDAERLMDDAGDEIERLRAMLGWQPISTAPKDGTHILMYRPLPGKSDCIAEAWWKADVFGDMCWGANGWTYPNFRPPTHWMPLPTPPEVQP